MISVPTAVKDALKSGDLPKNYRINVLNNDGTINFIIDNNTLVSESVKLDERMCSGDVLKFGLCEGSSLEFKYFNHPSILGRQVQVFIDVFYDLEDPTAYEPIPIGFYTVEECSRQAETGIRQVTAYNKLQSSYLDEKANDILLNNLTNTNLNISMYDIQHILLKNFQIETPKGEVIIGSHVRVYGLDQEGGRLAAKISSKTYETPLNSYFSREHPTVTFYLNQLCFGYICDLDPNEYYTLDTQIDFSSWEQSLYDYIKTYIDSSKLNITGTSFLNNILSKTNGCRGLMCIELRKNDALVARYSDIGYQKYPARVKGGFKDIIGHSFTGCDEVVIWLAYSTDCMIRQSVSNQDLYFGVVYSGDDEEYYDINGTVQYYPSFKTLDGESFTRLPYLRDNSACYLLDLSEAEKVTMIANTIPEFTLRNIVSATYETECTFGKLSRVTDLFSGVPLSPGAPHETITKDMYSKLWADEDNVRKWRYLIITYKGLENGQEKQLTLQRTINADGTDDYNMSNNWLFNNLVWTAEQVGAYADAMKTKMQNITWFPFEEWGAGLPYVETGDKVGITFGSQIYDSYVLQRQLNGIQNLQDTYINGTLDIF